MIVIFHFVGHYRGTGPLLVEKQVIVRKGDAYPIEQSAVARFKEGGHIEGIYRSLYGISYDSR